MRFYKEARADGGFDAGIEMALRAVLASTEFLFRIERDPKGRRAAARPIASATSSWPRACRSSCGAASPTTSCSDLAIAGRLNQPGDARAAGQADAGRAAKSEALVTNFAGQWLYLRNLAAASPDARTVPRLRRQPASGVPARDRAVLREHRAARTAACSTCCARTTPSSTSGWPSTTAFPNVYGSRFRRVSLGDEQRARRAARPGQHPDRDVVRQPHVAGASRQVDPREHPRHAAAATARERAAAAGHRRRAAGCSRCASAWCSIVRIRRAPSCHQLMDPAGLSMENFDAIGRWRTRTESGSECRRVGRAARRVRRSPA